MRHLPRPLVAAGLLAAGLVPGVAAAQAHDVRGLVTRDGVDFLASEVPRYVPTRLTPAPMSQSVGCVTATQRDTDIKLSVDQFAMTIPRAGRLSIDLRISTSGRGVLFARDVIACSGDVTCNDSFSASNVRARLDLDVALRSGAPEVSVAAVDVDLDPANFNLTFSGCVVADLANWIIGFAKETIVDVVVGEIEKAAAQEIAPKVEELLAGLGYDGTIDGIEFEAAIDELRLDAGGIALGASVDVANDYPAATCVADVDPGDPEDLDGEAPDLTSGPRTHVAVAANLGLINDALYHVWRKGLMCLTDAHLTALGLDVPLELAAEALPGFEPGSTLGIEIFMAEPLTAIGGDLEEEAALTLAVRDLQVTLVGRPPVGEERRIRVDVAATATAKVGINPATNALVAQIIALHVDRLELDQVYASEFGFDVNRLKDLVTDMVVPRALSELGSIPITGPVFTAAGYAILVRDLGATEAFLTVKSDLFPIPTDDHDPPATSLIRYPRGRVSPAEAILEVTAVDSRIPLELLQFRVTVDGVARAPSFIREFQIGMVGETDTYEVAVAAVDLSGNVDASPATISVEVDGIAPKIALLGPRVRNLEGPIDLQWAASDDLTASDNLGLRLEIFRVTDPTDLLATELYQTRVLPPGTTTARVDDLPGEALYRIEIHALDEVGNDASASVLVDLRTGGCRAAGGGGAAAGLLVGLAFVAVGLGRHRRR